MSGLECGLSEPGGAATGHCPSEPLSHTSVPLRRAHRLWVLGSEEQSTGSPSHSGRGPLGGSSQVRRELLTTDAVTACPCSTAFLSYLLF